MDVHMADTNQEFPYKVLGARLRRMREGLSESAAEVAGSVEVDLGVLADFEQGKQRPSEDILLLLISHFSLKEEEATKLWELAGYEKMESLDEALGAKNTVVVMPADARIAYTDMAHVVSNQHGVVINFLQTNGPATQPLIVSRLGMSKEHAKSLIELLERTLSPEAERPQRALPEPSQKESQEQNTEQ